ncbi:hypothetical protein [Natrialbaceae archaeon AArc-T1-2]|uniref:hypothetical protein n=1 Tax=Natrialbaceae archaeon AArc-T1-2 TaxID=3053904 RepID=UPI00255B189C|nr:hypothetical protein [Natrialbaceae archaeon AArc-T1-2]WIV68849.1 hypothetical protein QQ977_16235 [Natrialbaceae archaeon AArc-T1-2]
MQAIADRGYGIWFVRAIEHAVYADQRATVGLLKEVFAAGVVSDPVPRHCVA